MDHEWAYRFLVGWWPSWEKFIPYIREQVDKREENNASSVRFYLNMVTGTFNTKTPFFYHEALSWYHYPSWKTVQIGESLEAKASQPEYIDESDDEDPTDDATNMQEFQFDGLVLCCIDGRKNPASEGSFEQIIIATKERIQHIALDCYPKDSDSITFTSYRVDLDGFRHWLRKCADRRRKRKELKALDHPCLIPDLLNIVAQYVDGDSSPRRHLPRVYSRSMILLNDIAWADSDWEDES